MAMPVNFLGELKTRLKGRRDSQGTDRKLSDSDADVLSPPLPSTIHTKDSLKDYRLRSPSSTGMSPKSPVNSPDFDKKVNFLGELRTRLNSRGDSQGNDNESSSATTTDIMIPRRQSLCTDLSLTDECIEVGKPELSVPLSPSFCIDSASTDELVNVGTEELLVPLSLNSCTESVTVDKLVKVSSEIQMTILPISLCTNTAFTNDLVNVSASSQQCSTFNSDYEKTVSPNTALTSFNFTQSPDNFQLSACESIPLNHNFAKHKMAVRPKRRQGVPSRKQKSLESSHSFPPALEVIEGEDLNLTKLETNVKDTLLKYPEEVMNVVTNNGETCGLIEEMFVEECVDDSEVFEEIKKLALEDKSNEYNNKHLEVTGEGGVIGTQSKTVQESKTAFEFANSFEKQNFLSESSVSEFSEHSCQNSPPARPPRNKTNYAKMKFEYEIEEFFRRSREFKNSEEIQPDLINSNSNTETEVVEEQSSKSYTIENKSEILDDLDDFVVVEIFNDTLVVKEDIIIDNVPIANELSERNEGTKKSEEKEIDEENKDESSEVNLAEEYFDAVDTV